METPQKVQRKAASTTGSGRSATSKGSKTKGGRQIQFEGTQIFVQTFDGRLLTLNVEDDMTIGELKDKIGTKYGYLRHLHCLHDASGHALDDVCTLPDYGIKWHYTLQLSVRLQGEQTSQPPALGCENALAGVSQWQANQAAYKLKAADAEDSDLEEDVEEFRPTHSEEELKKAVRNSLSKALTSGGLHAKDIAGGSHSPSKRSHRVEARKLAQHKAATRQRSHSKDSAWPLDHTDLSSVVQSFFPSMFVGCTPTIAKRASSGGA